MVLFRVEKVGVVSLSSLQCRRILEARLRLFVLGCHLGFGNCGGLGRGNISRWSKWSRR